MIDVLLKNMQGALREAAPRIGEGHGAFPPRASYVPPGSPQPATRQGQREIVAATLAAGMIAAEGKAVTAAEAVARWREVMGGAWAK